MQHVETLHDVFQKKVNQADLDYSKTKIEPVKVPYTDRRIVGDVLREATLMEANLRNAEATVNDAEAILKDLKARKDILEKGKKILADRLAGKPHRGRTWDMRSAADKTDKELSSVGDLIAYQEARRSRELKIGDNRRKVLREFLQHSPGEGMPTNAELLAQDREDEKILDQIEHRPESLASFA